LADIPLCIHIVTNPAQDYTNTPTAQITTSTTRTLTNFYRYDLAACFTLFNSVVLQISVMNRSSASQSQGQDNRAKQQQNEKRRERNRKKRLLNERYALVDTAGKRFTSTGPKFDIAAAAKLREGIQTRERTILALKRADHREGDNKDIPDLDTNHNHIANCEKEEDWEDEDDDDPNSIKRQL
jgi:hypothetical protein